MKKCIMKIKKWILKEEKWTFRTKKWTLKVYFAKKGREFSSKTIVHIQRLFEKYSFTKVFGRSEVMELLELKSSGASKLLSNLLQADIIERVSGCGKGKYRFK